MARVPLPSGGWADLLEVDQLTGAHLDIYQRHMAQAWIVEDDGRIARQRFGLAINTLPAVVCEFAVTAWHLPYAPDAPLPGNNPGVWGAVMTLRDRKALEAGTVPITRELHMDPAEIVGAAPTAADVHAVATGQASGPTPPAGGPEAASPEAQPRHAVVISTDGNAPSESGGGSTAGA